MAKIKTNLSPEELDKMAAAITKVAAFMRSQVLEKGVGSPTVKPKGAPSMQKDPVTDAKPASTVGLPAPGNTAGPGRGNTTSGIAATKVKPSDSQKTNVSMNSAVGGQEFVYLSKEQFPEAPKGTVDSTPKSWKLPAGLGRALAAKAEATAGKNAGKPEAAPTEPPTDDAAFNKQKNSRNVVVLHLKHGEIETITPLGGDNASETFKVKIKGNGSAIFKGNVEHLYDSVIESRDEKPAGEEGWKFNDKNSKWEKQKKEPINIYTNRMIGSFGSGNIPYRKNVEREESGYNVACLAGLDAFVPVTVSRTHEGKAYSLQQWKEGYSSITALEKAKGVEGAKNDWDVISKVIPREKQEKVAQQLMDLACFDILINNQDRHGNNYIINEEGEVQLIDHGFAFGNSMHGSRNHMLQNVFHKNKPISMSDTMKTRLNNQGLGDYKRAMPGMGEWEQGQAFLRSRYLVWLQDNHGSIDRQKFLNTMSTNDGTMQIPGDDSDWSFAGPNQEDMCGEHAMREGEGLLPHQMFESWSKAYLEQAASDPSHADYEDAKHLQEVGVFMAPGFCSFMNGKGADFYRSLKKHKEYESTIKPSFDIPKSVGQEMANRRQKKFEEVNESSKQSSEAGTVVGNNNNKTVAGPSDNKTKVER